MVKREVSASAIADTSTPSAKRRKDESATNADGREGAENSDQEQEAGGEAGDEGPVMKAEEIKDEGLKVLQVLKEAKNKEERLISFDFWRLPSKRQFPDYYEIIKRPIALDDIKTNLENSVYHTLEALRQDLEQCFKNAKKYNMRESVIWKDAKALQKLSNKEVDRVRKKYSDEDEEGDGSDSGKKKEKGVNIHRLMKNRLQKLVSKTDENEHQISAPFMDLPSKRKWPSYYKIIKRPICIEDIFKKIKRKEYHTIPDFVADVDLVFSNAMSFNEEGSEIWKYASILKNYFHQLMSDLPAKYNMHSADPNVEPAPNKIKLKIPGYGTTPHVETSGDAGEGGGSIRLRIPTLASENTASATSAANAAATVTSNGAVAQPAKKAALASPSASTSQAPPPPPSIPAPIPRPAKAISSLSSIVAEQQTPVASPAPSTPAVGSTTNAQNNTTAQIPPSTFYNPLIASSSSAIPATPVKASATPVPTPNPIAPATRNGISTPKPSLHAAGIHSVRLEVTPTGRKLPLLDLDSGVRSWAVRLGSDEKGLIVKNVKFEKSGNGDEGSDEERDKGPSEVVLPPKKRGRGRPRKNPVVDKPAESTAQENSEAANENAIIKKPTGIIPAAENVVVRLDGIVIAHKTSSEAQEGDVFDTLDAPTDAGGTKLKSSDEWDINLSSGRHMIEIGRKGGSVFWQVYVYV